MINLFKNKISIYYIFNYIVALLVVLLLPILIKVNLYDKVGIIIHMPINYLILKRFIFYKLEENNHTKKEIQKEFIVITGLFSIIIFTYYYGFSVAFIATVIHLVEVLILNTKKERQSNIINRNIKNYFKENKK